MAGSVRYQRCDRVFDWQILTVTAKKERGDMSAAVRELVDHKRTMLAVIKHKKS
jgi:hypothetical protein